MTEFPTEWQHWAWDRARQWPSVQPEQFVPIITIVLLGASLFVILSKQYDATVKHWAYGTVGTLIGYWLRPARAANRKKSN